ncbi:hypothetical protein Maq22A_c28025 [Methylobacterium aquaticum]|uniref:Uncharacterized protein n=1 Tax=Methylobacterium aquaticum TaxID=270351 RepID=A0A1Y0ZC06_9HYPH|nr:hypothetical protein Maq22A_c28025 [Methylobacterium aquaticum]
MGETLVSPPRGQLRAAQVLARVLRGALSAFSGSGAMDGRIGGLERAVTQAAGHGYRSGWWRAPVAGTATASPPTPDPTQDHAPRQEPLRRGPRRCRRRSARQRPVSFVAARGNRRRSVLLLSGRRLSSRARTTRPGARER